MVLRSTGGNPAFGAGDLNDEEVDPGVLSRTDPTSWTFFAEASGMWRASGCGRARQGLQNRSECTCLASQKAFSLNARVFAISKFAAIAVNSRENTLNQNRTLPSVAYIPGIYNKKYTSSSRNFCHERTNHPTSIKTQAP